MVQQYGCDRIPAKMSKSIASIRFSWLLPKACSDGCGAVAGARLKARLGGALRSVIDDVAGEDRRRRAVPKAKAPDRPVAPRRAFKPKVGRPSIEQVAAITSAIIDEATRSFLSLGFDAVSMDAIAANIGIAKGTLYSRFASKEALMHAVIDDRVRRWEEAEPLPGGDEEPIEHRLRHYARIIAHLAANTEAQALSRLIVGNGRRFPEIARSVRALGYDRIVGRIADDIRVAALRDGVPVFDAQDIAQRLIATINGWVLAYPDEDIPLAEIERFADRTAHLMLAARPLW